MSDTGMVSDVLTMRGKETLVYSPLTDGLPRPCCNAEGLVVLELRSMPSGVVSTLLRQLDRSIRPTDSGILTDAVRLQVAVAQPIEICFGGVSGLDPNRAYSLRRVRIFYGINSKISDRY